jgi:hypothetical protein
LKEQDQEEDHGKVGSDSFVTAQSQEADCGTSADGWCVSGTTTTTTTATASSRFFQY